MKSSITRLLATVLFSTSILTIPLTQAKAVDYWDDKTIIQDVVDGSQVVGQVRLPDWDLITFEDFPPVNGT